MHEFKVNELITLRLEKDKTNIYLNKVLFSQCKKLVRNLSSDQIKALDNLDSIESLGEVVPDSRFYISAHDEFWGHCSNLQAWVESGYDSSLLHYSLAFPLLKDLMLLGDSMARKVFREEIFKKIEKTQNISIIIYLVLNQYISWLKNEQISLLLEIIRENLLDSEISESVLDQILTYDREKYDLTENDIIFLIEYPKIKLFDLLVLFGDSFNKKYPNISYWTTYLINKLYYNKGDYFKNKVYEIFKAYKHKLEESSFLFKISDYYKLKWHKNQI